ncbi:hypothetical protein BLA29_006502 [Euroglyphus maynei]|uniref:Uncharacterized protein n=1 Tax=Euroglyphus maynei TaxID=6958 RepID=A0A1Y3B9V6_EURMA|nr:hypothetical protein BLA29_006502 [Euroglyphus maynei]
MSETAVDTGSSNAEKTIKEMKSDVQPSNKNQKSNLIFFMLIFSPSRTIRMVHILDKQKKLCARE